MRDVVFKLRVNSGGKDIVKTGAAEVGDGAAREICDRRHVNLHHIPRLA
jgi:hypothetical protein